jgi:hypothetical protein
MSYVIKAKYDAVQAELAALKREHEQLLDIAERVAAWFDRAGVKDREAEDLRAALDSTPAEPALEKARARIAEYHGVVEPVRETFDPDAVREVLAAWTSAANPSLHRFDSRRMFEALQKVAMSERK